MIAQRNFERAFLYPQLAVLAVTLLSLFGLFWASISQQNDLAREREIKHVETGLASQVEFIRNNIRDYALWTDAATNLAVDFDPAWANDNIGPYLYNVQGYERTFVIEPDGSTIYASMADAQSQDTAAAVFGKELHHVLGELNAVPFGSAHRIGHITQIGTEPHILVASPILPSIGEAKPAGLKRRYLVLAKTIDQKAMAKLSNDYDLSDLSLTANKPTNTALAAVALEDDKSGQIAAWVTWRPSAPGTAMRDRYLPWLILIAGAAILLALAVVRRAQSATNDLAASEASARHLASHDVLTGLPNRRAMRERGLRLMGEAKAVLYLDLDGFKEVNDLFGHQAGDALLREASRRLRTAIGEAGMLARVGGDEFSILFSGADSHDIAVAAADRIVQTLGEPFVANHINMVVSGSVGIALGGADDSVDDLARFADVAMYAAKSNGKNRWQVYSPEMDEGREVRKTLESELRVAIRNGDIDVVFQPIMDARTGKTASAEALARWTSPTQGPIGPAIFVPIAEESGLIVELGELVLRKACMAAKDWPVDIAVNLSPAQFWNQSLADDVMRILKECDFPPYRLELEITEGYLLSRPETAADIITQLRSHGIRLALDDFGTGFASIGYLRRFDLDRIKLDRSFVDCVEKDEEAMMVAQAVISLSQALKLPITAEGVENVMQSKMLTIAGCERLQGWYYGRPEQADKLTFLFDQENTSNQAVVGKPAKKRKAG